jgi:hypothetical protein
MQGGGRNFSAARLYEDNLKDVFSMNDDISHFGKQLQP